MINLIKRLLIDVFSKTHKVDNLAMASKKKPLKKSYEPNTFLAMASMHALFVEVTNSHQNTNRSIAFQSPKYFTSSLHTFSFSWATSKSQSCHLQQNKTTARLLVHSYGRGQEMNFLKKWKSAPSLEGGGRYKTTISGLVSYFNNSLRAEQRKNSIFFSVPLYKVQKTTVFHHQCHSVVC